MNFKTYLVESERTLADKGKDTNVLHGTIGICTEAGEILDAIKKSMFYGKPIDKVNIKEEIGDVMWYIAILCREFNLEMEDVLQTNINKLKARYPDKFTSENALNRDLDKERKILETTTDEFTSFRRTQIAEMIPYNKAVDMTNVSISQADLEQGSPKLGDMIARNPKNHADKWLVAETYFKDNFEPM